MPASRHASRIVKPFGTEKSFPLIFMDTPAITHHLPGGDARGREIP